MAGFSILLSLAPVSAAAGRYQVLAYLLELTARSAGDWLFPALQPIVLILFIGILVINGVCGDADARQQGACTDS